jgi:hypothetical protein
MYTSSCLENNVRPRREFDPSKAEDILEFRHFMSRGKWTGHQCPFVLEWPYLTIPDMLKDKFVLYTLGIEKYLGPTGE